MNECKKLWNEVFLILGTAVVITILARLGGLDMGWALSLSNPTSEFGRTVDVFAAYPGVIAAVIAIIFLLICPLRRKFPSARKSASIFLLTLLIGHNALIEGDIKRLSDRPRPREIKELNGPRDFRHPFTMPEKGSSGSFPSGSAAMGFLFAAPYFVLRREKKSAAYAFLAGGMVLGVVIGYFRMIVGAHFFTDIVWAWAIMFTVASVLSNLDIRPRDMKCE